MIYETDTDLVRVWSGSVWVETSSMLTKAPRGVIGFNEAPAATVTLTTASTTFCTVTFSLASTRQVQFIGNFPLFDLPSTTQIINGELFAGATRVANVQLSVSTTLTQQNMTIIRSYVLPAGSYTYTLRAYVNTGTNRSNSAAAGNVTLVSLTAIDIGAA
jgi:hypothetical protein